MPTREEIMTALRQVMDPELGKSLVELGMVRDLQTGEDGKVHFSLALTIASCPLRERMAAEARQAVLALPGVSDVEIAFTAMTDEERRAVLGNGALPLPQIKQFNQIGRITAVMSGKGGVGKSSITALLAAALARRACKVGILDADVTGPSIPKLFGLPAGGLRGGEQGMLPAITAGGIRVVSTNLLLREEDLAVIWRGPMISATITQFWNETLWGRLDHLLIDLPPGTSDAALTVLQTLPVDGVLLVTTPQELASLVVRKAVHMLKELKMPVLGIVENMSYFRAPESGVVHELFGPSHAGEIAAAAGSEVWGRLPIDPQIAALCDAGRAEEVASPEIEALAGRLLQPRAQPAGR